MIPPSFQRLALITGERTLEKLAQTKVLVFGLGGVGSWCAEALVRSGIGSIGIVDFDTVSVSNINRQVQATGRTLGLSKAKALQERLLEINENCEVRALDKIFRRENAGEFGIESADYVIDAIDSLNQKLDLIEITCAAGVPLFSSMGMAQRLDPTRIKTANVWDTCGCPLARHVREGLRRRGFLGGFTAVYSDERIPRREDAAADREETAPPREYADSGEAASDRKGKAAGRPVNGSAVTVTACAGMILASLVLRDIMEKQ
jgi:tRNA A37 threonylcarbamoyladenosine dehydratase